MKYYPTIYFRQRTLDKGHWTKDTGQRHWAKDIGQRTQDKGHRTKDTGQRTLDKEPK